MGGALREYFLCFVRCINERQLPDITTPEESMATVHTMLTAGESAARGNAVMVDWRS